MMRPDNSQKTKITFFSILLLAAIWHFWSLPYSPLPWFDETFFASVTHSYINDDGFDLKVCPLQTNGKPVLIYGPIYFMITGFFTKLLGFDVFSFRLANLIGAIITILIFFKIANRLNWKKKSIYLFTIILTFDVIFIQNAHSGRMDLVAISMFLGAIYVYISKKTSRYQLLLISLLGTLSMLTTLRMGLFIIPVYGIIYLEAIKEKKYQALTISLICSILLYSIWIFTGFGSIENFISEYTKSESNNYTGQALTTSFLGGNFKPQFYQYPMILMGLLSVAIILKKRFKDYHFWILLLPVILFYLLIKDTGAYSAMVVPFWYLLIGIAYHEFMGQENINFKRVIPVLPVLLLLINAGIFIIKSATIITTIPQRDNNLLTKWVNNHIPAGSKVVGDDRYYYAVINNQSDFQYLQRILSNEERALYHKKNYHPDYLFISNQTRPEMINAYKKHFEFSETHKYTPPTQQNLFTMITSKIPMQIQSSLEGTLIKIHPKNN